jgi:hypothetical protein
MPTPILPTRAQLRDLVFTPRQLVADAAAEQFLTVTNNYDFVLELITAYRSGALATWADTAIDLEVELTSPTHTEFVYFSDLATANSLINFLTHVDYGYAYTVKIAKGTAWEARTTAVTLSPPTDPYILVGGAHDGEYALLVSWPITS